MLTPGERDGLFQVMRGLAADGRTILFVTHKIHEVMAVTDRITVLRDGRVADRMVTAETDPQAIIRAMTGRNVTLKVDKAPAEPGRALLEVEGLVLAAPGKPAVDGVSFAVRAGEIVGIAGVAGNGQTELIEIVAGLRAADAGAIRVDGRDVTAAGVAGRRAAGIAYVPEDRAHTGTALRASATDNCRMGFHRRPPLSRRGVLDRGGDARPGARPDRPLRHQDPGRGRGRSAACPAATCRRWWWRASWTIRRRC